MDKATLIYLVFGVVILLGLVFDLGLLSKKNQVVNTRAALVQTAFWVLLSLAFCVFIWAEDKGGTGKTDAILYISAYLLEWSLSLDNIFVFIIIFSFFGVKPNNYSRVLLLGILMAIVFRIGFIAAGTILVARFDWIMYVFSAFLLYIGIKLFNQAEEAEFDPGESRILRFMKKYMRTTGDEPHGRFIITKNKKTFFTRLAMAVVMLGLIDIVFALDSIPAVFSIIPDPGKKLLIYSSNIFAVLGLRSLFFLLRGAASKFDYLQQGIAIVLIFIGLKILMTNWLGYHLPTWVSLLVIVSCITGSIVYSTYHTRKGSPKNSGV
jgi:tellurite resistance protein TerC